MCHKIFQTSLKHHKPKKTQSVRYEQFCVAGMNASRLVFSEMHEVSQQMAPQTAHPKRLF